MKKEGKSKGKMKIKKEKIKNTVNRRGTNQEKREKIKRIQNERLTSR